MGNPEHCKRTNFNQWAHCSVCGGRIHEADCTSKRNKKKDCCHARHKMLFDQGELVGRLDESMPMFDEQKPTWAA